MSKGLVELNKIKNYKELTTVANIGGYERVHCKLAYNDELKASFAIIEKELKEHEQCENIRKEWKCDIAKVNEMLRHGYWVKFGTNEKGFTYKHYVPNDENVICLRHLGYDVEICCVTSKNERNAPITGFNEISLSEYGTRLALTKEELL